MTEAVKTPGWDSLEGWLLERHTETGDVRYQDAATALYQGRHRLAALAAQNNALAYDKHELQDELAEGPTLTPEQLAEHEADFGKWIKERIARDEALLTAARFRGVIGLTVVDLVSACLVLHDGRVSRRGMKDFADGFIAPVIRRLKAELETL